MAFSEFSAVQVFKWKLRHRRKQSWFKKQARKSAIAKYRQVILAAKAAELEVARVDFGRRWYALWMGVGIMVEQGRAPQG